MIRSRLVGSLRRQDWMAVAIELATVVLGLFLGLQLNEWNEARKASVREQADLVRLEQESETDVNVFHIIVARFDRLNVEQESAIGALSTGDKAKFNSRELADSILSLSYYPGIAPPRAVYDELSSSGQINEIGSSSVRVAVASYYAELSYIQSQLEYFRQGASAESARPAIGQTTTYDSRGRAFDDRFINTADFDAIAKDRGFMTQLVNDLRDQVVFQTYRIDVATKAVAMCKALAEALHRVCAAAGNHSTAGEQIPSNRSIANPDGVKTVR